MVTKYLRWFQQSFPFNDVLYQYDFEVPGVQGTYVANGTLSNMALQEHAEANGKTTWDEVDVCMMGGCVLPEGVYQMPEPEPVDLEPQLPLFIPQDEQTPLPPHVPPAEEPVTPLPPSEEPTPPEAPAPSEAEPAV